MSVESFNFSVRSYIGRKPFKPFLIIFKEGDHVQVDHPEALYTRAGTSLHVDTRGKPTLFDADSVSRLTELPQLTASQAT